MSLNIDNYGGKGVVPVFCGSYVSGTAFFISQTHLLTAGHVLAEYYLDEEATVAVVVEEEYKVCRVLVHQAIPDVALQTILQGYSNPNSMVLVQKQICRYSSIRKPYMHPLLTHRLQT